MLATLLESRPVRDRSRSAATVSLIAHTAVITVAVFATAVATTPDPLSDPPEALVYVTPAAPPPPAAPVPTPEPAAPPTGPVPEIPVPAISTPSVVPSGLPDVPLSSLAIEPVTRIGPATGTPTPGVPGATGPATGAPWSELTVDRAARLVRNTSRPGYPDLLRRDRVEGSVLATYVVDTLGRVEPGSFTVLESTHPLFERSVRDALAAMRFVPAEAGGRRVRQLVQQSFLFTLRR